MSITDVKREHVLKAISEFETLGRLNFLKEYKVSSSRGIWLKNKGHEIDAKALFRVAHVFANNNGVALTSNDLNENAYAIKRRFEALGFENFRHDYRPRGRLIPALDGELDNDVQDGSRAVERERVARLILARRGQQDFRKRLIKAHHSTCVVSKTSVLDVLEAAHILPASEGGDNSLSNGLLLRADLHTLFDLRLMAIEPETRIIFFAKKLAGNQPYNEFQGTKVLLPANIALNREALKKRWEAREK